MPGTVCMARAAGSAVIAGDEETKKDTMRVRSAKAEIRQSRIISTSNDWRQPEELGFCSSGWCMLDEKLREFEIDELGRALFFALLQRPINVFGFERQVVNAHSDGIGDRVADGGGCRRESGFAETFGPVRSFGLGALDD